MLEKHENGTFLLRVSPNAPAPGNWVISVIEAGEPRRVVNHYRVSSAPGGVRAVGSNETHVVRSMMLLCLSIPFTLFVYCLFWQSVKALIKSVPHLGQPLSRAQATDTVMVQLVPDNEPIGKGSSGTVYKVSVNRVLLQECFVVVHCLLYAGENKRYGLGVGCEAVGRRRVD